MSQFTEVKKRKTFEKINLFIPQFRNIILCEIKDIPADMIHKIRKQLRDINTEVVCGKSVNINKFFLKFKFMN